MNQVLAVIPARGGSKGIPRKNLRPLAGKPLIEISIRFALSIPEVDRVVVSTESHEIGQFAEKLGAEVPFVRPAELAQDETPMLDVLYHAVGQVEREGWKPECILLLQPTAPLRRSRHVRQALEIFEATGCDSVVSVVPVPGHYLPHYVMKLDEDGRLKYFLPEGEFITRRQDAPPAYSRDGTVYVIRRDVLMEQKSIYGFDCRPMLMNETESVNLDTLEDWGRAEKLIDQSPTEATQD